MRASNMKKEADVKQEVRAILNSFGDQIWWFMPVPTGFGVQGVPDFVCVVRGRFVGIETKFGGNKLSKWQAHQRDQILKARGVHWIIDEETIVDLPALVEAIIALES